MTHPTLFYINTIMIGALAIETGICSIIYGLDCYRRPRWWLPIVFLIHLFIYLISIGTFFYALGEW